MSEILKEILKELPDGKISDAGFEGANIVLYTKDRKFVFEANGMIKDIVNKIKKRIELRPDPSITHDSELAEKEIREIIPAEAKIDQIIFDPQRSIVIIEAEKPGVAIGKQGENLKAIKEKVLWVPVIKRTPAIRSQIIENIRAVLYQNSDYRRKFLHKVGQRIYNGWLRGKKDEWIRISYLGSGRQVGSGGERQRGVGALPQVQLGAGVEKVGMGGLQHCHHQSARMRDLGEAGFLH